MCALSVDKPGAGGVRRGAGARAGVCSSVRSGASRLQRNEAVSQGNTAAQGALGCHYLC